MAGIADSSVGAILEIPPSVLGTIADAERAIKSLQATSETAARKIKGHFDNTAVSGLNAFIKKVNEANTKLGAIKMPTIDGGSFASSISAIVSAMASIDRSTITGAKRLEKVVSAVSSVDSARSFADMLKEIANGITAIGNTSQQTIQNVSSLAQAMATLAKDIRTVQNAQRQQGQGQTLATANVAEINKLYKEQVNLKLQENQLKAKSKNLTKEEQAQLQAIIARYAEIQKRIADIKQQNKSISSSLALTRGDTSMQRLDSRAGAINYAKNAKSLKDLQDAYKNLKAVMGSVDPKSAEWKKMNTVYQDTKKRIDDIRKSMGELQTQSRRTGDMAAQLRNQLTAAFSVAAISGYIKKMVEVRAQFELQNVALRAILQNKDEADRIFMQVQQMALQSPFTIMQLTTYSKQLAAYRIEADKLVGTTKMLADVSAGLGVDMQRLILAYGQVKAANYLRATEVRQFTEAGLNIAGELATYFSELQGKMISVGDVMEMITKRMVRFEDVEEVFKRVTSAGGLFYDMQKKQSASLYGQLQRISDAYSIMMNEIGKSNQTEISEALILIRAFINHWREIAQVIKVAGSAFAAFYLIFKAFSKTSITFSLVKKFEALYRTIKMNIMAAGGLKAALLSLNSVGFMAIIGAIAAIAYSIYTLTNNTSALSEELTRVSNESLADMYDLVQNFKELADNATDATKPYEDRAKAIEELHRVYKDILPAEMLEIENLRNMATGYDEATEAIRIFSIEKAKSKAKEAIENDINKQWETLITRIKNSAGYIRSHIKELQDIPTASLRGIMANIMMQVKSEIDEGTITVDQAWDRFRNIFLNTTGVLLHEDSSTRGLRSYFGQVTVMYTDLHDDIFDVVNNSKDAMEEYTATFGELLTAQERADEKAAKKFIDGYNERTKVLKNFNKALNSVKEMQLKGTLKDDDGAFTDMGITAMLELYQAYDNLNLFQDKIGATAIEWENVEKGIYSNTDALTVFDTVQRQIMGDFLANMQSTDEYASNTYLKGFAQRVKKNTDAAGIQDTQMDIINLAREQAQATGVSVLMLDKLKTDANTSYSSAAKDAHSLSEACADNIKKIVATKTQLIALGRTASEAQLEAEMKHGNGQTEADLKKEQEYWDKLSKLLGYSEKEKDRRGTDPWQSRLSLFKEINTEYEKLLRYYTKEAAYLKIEESYGKAIAEIYAKQGKFSNIKNWGGFDKASMIKAGEEMLKTLSITPEKRKQLEKELAGMRATLDIEIQEKAKERMQKEIDGIFDNYELSKTFTDIGLNIDLTYIVGGKPTTIKEAAMQIRKAYTDAVKEGKLGEEAEKAYQDAMKKIADIEHKNQIERIKNYNKYLLESMSERVQIEIKAQREISAIRNNATLDDTTKQMAAMRREQQMRSDLAKQEWKDFQGSDIYISMFEDMEHASTQSLQYMLEKLRSLKDSLKSLPADQVRAIVKQIESIEKQINTRNPFKALSENIGLAIKSYRQLKNASLDFQRTNEQYELAKEQRDNYALRLTQLEEELKIAESQAEVDEDGNVIATAHIANLREKVRLRREELKLMGKNVDALEKEQNRLSKIVSDLKNGREAAGQALQQIGSWAKEVSGSIENIASSMENVFGVMDDGSQDSLDSVMGILNGVGDMAAGYGRFMAGDMIGGAAQALSGLASTIGEIAAIGDKKKARQIARLKEKVEELDKAYQKLEKSIEAAYTFDDYNEGYDQMKANLEAQRQHYEEMIALEEAKKKSDNESLKEYQDALDEIAEKEEEIRKDRIEAQGSTTDYLSEAEGFVSAWLDAYREVGDGTDALKEHWDDFIDSLVVKQAAAAIVSGQLKQVIDKINTAIDEGKTGYDLADTVKDATDEWKDKAPAINEALKSIFDAFGVSLGNGELLLSDLQKGIQNITEPQAAAIEAYLNSMRFAVFQHTEQLERLINAVSAQYGTGESPMLQEVRDIKNLLQNIDATLQRVVLPRGGDKGYFLKVG